MTTKANIAKAVDLLERQTCNCIYKIGSKKVAILCLRCELLSLLK